MTRAPSRTPDLDMPHTPHGAEPVSTPTSRCQTRNTLAVNLSLCLGHKPRPSLILRFCDAPAPVLIPRQGPDQPTHLTHEMPLIEHTPYRAVPLPVPPQQPPSSYSTMHLHVSLPRPRTCPMSCMVASTQKPSPTSVRARTLSASRPAVDMVRPTRDSSARTTPRT